MKKPYQPPRVEIVPTDSPDFLVTSGIPVTEDPDPGFGEIKFF